MPIRLRITTFFTGLFILLLGIVCLSIYYFSSLSRLQNVKTRLTNRAITTDRMLTHDTTINKEMMYRIDSLTAMALKRKAVQVYNADGQLDYFYADASGDSMPVSPAVLAAARRSGTFYFNQGTREAIAYSDRTLKNGIVIVSVGVDEDGRENIDQLRSILISSFIGGILLAFIGGYIFSAGLLKPVRRIANEVKEISAHNLERRIPAGDTHDEWHLLASTLNQLLDRLKDSFELQRRFISNASHELSTPLTLISSQLEIYLQRDRSEAAYREAMTQILKDVQHMNSLVQALLQFATASRNPGGLQIGPVRIDEVLMQLPGEVHARDTQHSVSLDFGTLPEEDDKLLVLGNETLIFTAIMNIVSNACKYSGDHHADVSLLVEDHHFIIRVKDQGIGIDEQEINNIFQPFYRIEQEHNSKGFGLGLSLATRIIKLHKGDITVSSTPGVGTVFTIVLPGGEV
ncbi:HAMP domain-containing histidine kinase [Chitinophaga horti]|uniref:histidine kinase n=1 Tax=Chitinophaga horti TaxID=2920382 RepID=A0ABY6JBR9_9BACT|nr:HAMP domain-containing sensor histidine kinase [Chitinophaga horti]UYQ95759.1 HAMP domain-containing histidine kinase [Chitinophaga horti]